MIQYQRNNIIFRIASAEAISNFKSAQASSFIQLTRKELVFDDSAKETILLEFDRFSFWVTRIEKMCLISGESVLSESIITTICDYFTEELLTIESVMDSYTDVFTNHVKAFAKMIHGYASKIILEKFNKYSGARMDSGFVLIVRSISDYLQHLLLSFHEFNNNIVTKATEPFICAPNFCSSRSAHSFIPETHRINFYTHNNVGNIFVLKNYSDQVLFAPAVEHFDKMGITIVPEEEHFKDQIYLPISE